MSVFDKFSGIGVASGFKLQAKAPLDPRQVVDSIDDRNALITENGAYEGMKVYVKADKKTYCLKDLVAETWEEDGAGGGGASVQPDYNQNDATQPDYIKNRPFYAEAPMVEEETLLDQTFSTITAGGRNIWATKIPVIQFARGDTVKVVYNGTEYTQEVKELIGCLYIGNLHIYSSSELNTGEPFLVANIYLPDGLSALTPGTTVGTSEPQTDATIKITKMVENIHQMDGKFVKDMYYSVTNPEQTVIDTVVTTEADTWKEIEGGDFPPYMTKCRVIFDGKEYIVKAGMIMGNNSSDSFPLLGNEKFSKYPFVIRQGYVDGKGSWVDSGTFVTRIKTKNNYSGQVKVTYVTETVVKGIDDKYVGNCRINVGVLPEGQGGVASFDDIISRIQAILQSDEGLFDKVMDHETTRLVIYGTRYVGIVCVNFMFTLRADYNNEYSAKQKSFVTVTDISSLFGAVPSIMVRLLITNSGNGISVGGGACQLLDNQHYTFGISDDIIDVDAYDSSRAYLGLLQSDEGNLANFNGKVLLADWIKYSQKREDFTVPEPLNPRDLVDKEYVDGLNIIRQDLTASNVVAQDLTANGFTPVPNTYYKHTGTSGEFLIQGTWYTITNGKVYFYNGTGYEEAAEFIPVANTYYRHTGATTASYTKGKIYFYDGSSYAVVDGTKPKYMHEISFTYVVNAAGVMSVQFTLITDSATALTKETAPKALYDAGYVWSSEIYTNGGTQNWKSASGTRIQHTTGDSGSTRFYLVCGIIGNEGAATGTYIFTIRTQGIGGNLANDAVWTTEEKNFAITSGEIATFTDSVTAI